MRTGLALTMTNMSSRPRPTMKDVAGAAGVSFKTVSRVVNGEGGVSPALTERVLEAVATLGYHPDDRAQRLRRGEQSSATIGLIHADIANPFFAAVHSGVEAVARDRSCLILSGSSGHAPERQQDLVRAFAGRRVDGFIVVPTGDTSGEYTPSPAVEAEIRRGTPIVFVDRDPGLEGDVVVSDNYGGASLATQHLLDRGHERIAFLGSRDHVYSAAERSRGFHETMHGAGHSVAMVRLDLRSAAEAEERVRELLAVDEPPTAIFSAQNYLSIGTVRALHRAGKQHDVAMVGFDDFEMADVVEPGISVIPQDGAALGRMAGELLFERLQGSEGGPTRKVLSVSLVARGSGEIPRR